VIYCDATVMLCWAGEYNRARGEILQEGASRSSDGDSDAPGRTAAAMSQSAAANETLQQ